MPTRRRSKGIYRRGSGWRAVVNTTAGRRERSFPFDTSVAVMQRWRRSAKAALDAQVSSVSNREDAIALVRASRSDREHRAIEAAMESELRDAWRALPSTKVRRAFLDALKVFAYLTTEG